MNVYQPIYRHYETPQFLAVHPWEGVSAYGNSMALNFQLRRDAHAIGEFTAKLVFAQAISARAFSSAVERLREVAAKLDLPAEMNVQFVKIRIGNPPSPQPPDGLGFQRFQKDGEVACSVYCDSDGITFTLRDYDRWQNVLPQVVESFSHIAPAYMAEVPAIKAFQVQYLNEFASINAPETPTREIFREGCRWVSPFSYDSLQPWHCHVGQFIPVNDNSRYLININCDVNTRPFPPTDGTRNFASVLILVSRQYDLPNSGPLVIEVEKLRAALEKSLLGEIISDDYLDVMGDGARDIN